MPIKYASAVQNNFACLTASINQAIEDATTLFYTHNSFVQVQTGYRGKLLKILAFRKISSLTQNLYSAMEEIFPDCYTLQPL